MGPRARTALPRILNRLEGKVEDANECALLLGAVSKLLVRDRLSPADHFRPAQDPATALILRKYLAHGSTEVQVSAAWAWLVTGGPAGTVLPLLVKAAADDGWGIGLPAIQVLG